MAHESGRWEGKRPQNSAAFINSPQSHKRNPVRTIVSQPTKPDDFFIEPRRMLTAASEVVDRPGAAKNQRGSPMADATCWTTKGFGMVSRIAMGEFHAV